MNSAINWAKGCTVAYKLNIPFKRNKQQCSYVSHCTHLLIETGELLIVSTLLQPSDFCIQKTMAVLSQSSWIKHLAGHPECKFTVTQQPLTASFTHPGLTYSSFDRDGKIDILNLLSYVVDVRLFAEHYPYSEKQEKWFHWNRILDDRSIFMSSVQVVLSRNIHNKKVPKWPLEVKVTFGYIGKSSLSISLAVYSPGSQEPLLSHVVQFVVVDTQTRKPKPFPDWFINKYTDQCSMKTGFRLQTFPRPAKTFVYRREVMFLETDINNHTNFASYVRYALDGLYAAVRHQAEAGVAPHNRSNSGCHDLPAPILQTCSSSGGLRNGARDIIKDGLKSLNICYVNECLEGEIIDIHIWQEDNESYIVRCSIEKGSKVICQLTLEYFTPLAKL